MRNRQAMVVSLGLAVFAAGCTSGGAGTSENDTGVNHAPTISGAPTAAVNADQPWSFTPSASDPDGGTLTFSIQNLPSWATFDSSTGLLSGTPHIADIGMYSDIRIEVSDGSLSDSLGPFSVEVTQVALGSLTVAWSLPSQYSDGTALTGHIANINLYYGVEQGSYPNRIEVSGTGTTTYVVENLVPDTYYFVATVVDDQGVESSWSAIGSATVQ